MKSTFKLAVASAAVVLVTGTAAYAQKTVEAIKARGELVCGVILLVVVNHTYSRVLVFRGETEGERYEGKIGGVVSSFHSMPSFCQYKFVLL